MATVLKTVTAYCGNWKKHAINGLPMVKLAIQHVAAHGDYSPLVHLRLIDSAPVQKQIEMIAAAFGLKFIADSKENGQKTTLGFTIALKGNGKLLGMALDETAMAKLDRLISERAALGGKDTADTFNYANMDEKAAADKAKAEKKAEKEAAQAAEKAQEIEGAKRAASVDDIVAWFALNIEKMGGKDLARFNGLVSAEMLRRESIAAAHKRAPKLKAA